MTDRKSQKWPGRKPGAGAHQNADKPGGRFDTTFVAKPGGRPDKRSDQPREGRSERPRQGGSDMRRRGDPARDHGGDTVTLWGMHPVREALRSTRRDIVRLLATELAAERLAPEIAARGLTPTILDGSEIARRIPPEAVHQGVVAIVRPLPTRTVSDLPENGLVLVLDQVTDPHNVGAILRTACAFGVDAVIVTERHAPALTGVLAKSASGALEHVDLVAVVNLARAMEALGERGYTRIGLDSDGEASLETLTLARPLALALGAEGKGLRRLTRENCDALARVDLPGAIRSLNVSNACAVALTIARMKGV